MTQKTKLGNHIALACLVALACGCGQADRIKELEAEVQRLKQHIEQKPADAAGKAIRELRKIRSATEMGLSYTDYRKILLETKPSVDEALVEMPANPLKDELAATMATYVDAGRFWNMILTREMFSDGYYDFTKEEAEEFGLYKIPFKKARVADGSTNYFGHLAMLTNFWTTAALSVAQVEATLKRESGKSISPP